MFKDLATALNGSGAPAPAPVVAKKKQETAIVMLPEMVELKRIRLELGLTQKQLGEMLGTKNLNRWERGEVIPHTRNLLAVRKFIANHAPKSERHVVKRAGAVPLRFRGVSLGQFLLSSGELLTLYRTDGGQVVWDTNGTVNYGTTEAFVEYVDYWAGPKQRDEVLAFAADSGLEIFEDID